MHRLKVRAPGGTHHYNLAILLNLDVPGNIPCPKVSDDRSGVAKTGIERTIRQVSGDQEVTVVTIWLSLTRNDDLSVLLQRDVVSAFVGFKINPDKPIGAEALVGNPARVIARQSEITSWNRQPDQIRIRPPLFCYPQVGSRPYAASSVELKSVLTRPSVPNAVSGLPFDLYRATAKSSPF